MPSVCFVCLGNICRSPMAEAVFAHLLRERGADDGWTVDSAGTGAWHVGKSPDPRTLAILKREGIPLRRVGRQIHRDDFDRFDWLLAMDDDNLAVLRERAPRTAPAAIELLGSYDPAGEREVPDPYYGGDDGFERVYVMLQRCCSAFLDRVDRSSRPTT